MFSLNYYLQSSVPVLTELTNHGSFEEFPKRETFFLAFALGRDADTPFMVEDVGEAILFHQADRVEVA